MAEQIEEQLKQVPTGTFRQIHTPRRVELSVQDDITPKEAFMLGLYMMSQCHPAQYNPDIALEINGLKYENFSHHFKEVG